MSLLSQTHLQDEEAAYAWVEAHVWPDGPVCPHCKDKARISKMQGSATRFGLYKCYACRKQFRVTVGTIFEKSHIPLRLWLQAFYLIAGSKKGISSNQLHRTLGVTLKSAWFMSHRIREAMRVGSLSPPMGGDGGVVEVDETYFGTKSKKAKHLGKANKHAVLTLVNRKGEARSFQIETTSVAQIIPIVRDNISQEAKVVTDDSLIYRHLVPDYSHASVNHSKKEYVRGEVHTNTVERYLAWRRKG